MRRIQYPLLLSFCLLLPACRQPYADTAEAPGESDSPVPDAGPETTAVSDAGTITLTADSAQIQFVGTHAGDDPNPRKGVFQEFSGQAAVDRELGILKSVSVDIQVDSLVTPFDKLTNHLKSPDFFDAREHPTARFESTGVDADDDTGEQLVIGKLTLMGTTKEVSFPVDVTISGDELTVTGELTINRSEFGMDKLLDKVNDEVEISVAIGKPTVPPTAAEPN